VTTEEWAEAFKDEWKEECLRRGCRDLIAVPDVADLKPLLDAAVAEEREACARLADEEGKRCGSEHGTDAARRIAGSIRARGRGT
jgi:hypothetical protein